jgi:C4-dicarboxylate-specific signal transduction histidine kinase
MAQPHLRFATDILRRLGEELIPHPDQGIVELVRNAYDADATTCRIELIDADQENGTLRITDNGVGMTRNAILNGWLVLGRSGKATHKRTKLGRIPVGEKGLGRLAALRMGTKAELTTRPKSERRRQYRVIFDWDQFEHAKVVEEVPIPVTLHARENKDKAGTTIEITNLRSRFRRAEVTRLARALLLLSDPFDHSESFKPTLVAPEFADIEARVRQSYFDQSDFHLHATVDAKGHATAVVKGGDDRVLYSAEGETLHGEEGPYQCPLAEFELWVFLLGGERFVPRPVGVTEIRQWLKVVGGVHLYQRGLRVHPYGDPGHDWLEMNLARTRSPEERPSTNTSIGRVVVNDRKNELIQKTDRSGFIENDAYRELKRFAQDALEFMAKERLRAAETRREQQKQEAPSDVSEARVALDEAIGDLPPKAQAALRVAVDQFDAATRKRQALLEEELRLYRTLATVGTTSAVFAHEVTKPVTQIEKAAGIVQRRIAKYLTDPSDRETIEKPLDLIVRSAKALRSFARVPLTLMQRRKRKTGHVVLHDVINEVAALLQPFLAESQVKVVLDLSPEDLVVSGSFAEIQAVIANLFTNAINAFNAKPTDRERQIHVTTKVAERNIVISFSDSGAGITGIALHDIWLPGYSTFQAGSGLGLTIVRDIVTDLGGAAQALAHGELGGAEFIVQLPRAEEIQ